MTRDREREDQPALLHHQRLMCFARDPRATMSACLRGLCGSSALQVVHRSGSCAQVPSALSLAQCIRDRPLLIACRCAHVRVHILTALARPLSLDPTLSALASSLARRKLVFCSFHAPRRYMHDKHVLHRDLKTQNLFLTSSDRPTGPLGEICSTAL